MRQQGRSDEAAGTVLNCPAKEYILLEYILFLFFWNKVLNKAYKLIVYDSAYLQGEGLLSLI